MAYNIDPIKLLIFLRILCKEGYPLWLIKAKARLGKLVHSKNGKFLIFTEVQMEDLADLDFLSKSFALSLKTTKTSKNKDCGVFGTKNLHLMAN